MAFGNSHDEPVFPEPLHFARAPTAPETSTGGDDAITSKTPPTLAKRFAIVAFTSIALYNVIELTCIIFIIFKRRRGLYFTSFCVATWGIPPHTIGFLILALEAHTKSTIQGTWL